MTEKQHFQRRHTKVMGNFPLVPFQTLFKHKTNVVCQSEWQIDLMLGHSKPLMEVINAEQ